VSNAKGHGRTGRPWRRIRAEVLAASDVCWLCGKADPPADTVDHILPISKYPELAHDMANLRPAHRSCNSRKGAGGVTPHVRPMPKSRHW
jgi:5-methylcytosine-specific restriction endonuclease McrA